MDAASPPSEPQSLPAWFAWLNRTLPNPDLVVLLLATLIGGGSGLLIVGFHYLYDTLNDWMFGQVAASLSQWGYWTLALIPTMGGLVVGLMRLRWSTFGPGLRELIATANGEQAPQPLHTLQKLIAASISLGSGASLGPEGPSVETGGNLGLALGLRLRMSEERQRLLLGAGAAAGLAAGFNAPVAGVFFAIEVVLGTAFATSSVSVVLVAAVISALIAQIGLGAQPAFDLPAYEVRSPLELPLYLGLGLLASFVAWSLTHGFAFVRQAFAGEIPNLRGLALVPPWLQPVCGGLMVGIVALALPQILGVGYDTIEAMLRDYPISLGALLLLLLVKLVVTAISGGSGLVGGGFAPSLFLGAVLGSLYGRTMALILPFAIADSPAYAMVGMAAVLAGSARAPLTAMLLLFELTRDYRIVVPLMAAAGLSAWIIEQLNQVTTGESLPGLPMALEGEAELLRQIPVEEALQDEPLVLDASLGAIAALEQILDRGCRYALVLEDPDRIVGIVTLHDLNHHLSRSEPEPNQLISHLATPDLIYAIAGESIATALARMEPRGLHQIPVFACDPTAGPLFRENLQGVLDRDGIRLACTRLLLRRRLLNSIAQPQLALTTGDRP
jgi:H+/Cl- antiporter ClcA